MPLKKKAKLTKGVKPGKGKKHRKENRLSRLFTFRIVPDKGLVFPLVYVAYPREKIHVRTYGHPVEVSIGGPKGGPPQTIQVGRGARITAPTAAGVYDLKIDVIQPSTLNADMMKGAPPPSPTPPTTMGSPIIIVEP
jgi:hypothetical protein